MKKTTLLLLLLSMTIPVLPGTGEEREKIRISVSGDRVIPVAQRVKALEIGGGLLDNTGLDLETLLNELHTPFQFKRLEVATVEEEEDDEETGDGGVRQPRDDFEVLRILAPRLQREVQGSLILGQRKRLIWAGGQSVETGYTFQTRISESDPTLYNITISEIREKSFSIRLNEAEITIPIGDTSNSGVVRGGDA